MYCAVIVGSRQSEGGFARSIPSAKPTREVGYHRTNHTRPPPVLAGLFFLRLQAMLDAFLLLLNVAALVGYGAIPLDVFFPQRSLLTDWLPPGESLRPAQPSQTKPNGAPNKVERLTEMVGKVHYIVGEPSVAPERESKLRCMRSCIQI